VLFESSVLIAKIYLSITFKPPPRIFSTEKVKASKATIVSTTNGSAGGTTHAASYLFASIHGLDHRLP
jgi:hypothetical protein